MLETNMPSDAKTRSIEIDISRPARALRWLRWADHSLLLGGLLSVSFLALAFDLILTGQEILLASALVAITAIFLFGAYTGWRHLSVIEPQVWPLHIVVFAVIFPVAIALYILSILMMLSAMHAPDAESKYGLTMLGNLIMTLGGASGPLSILGLIAAIRLRRHRVSFFDLPLSDIISNIGTSASRQALPVSLKNRISPPKGIACLSIGLALAIFPIGSIIPETLVKRIADTLPPHVTPSTTYLAETLLSGPAHFALWLIGCYFLLRARRYFQIDAETLISLDTRRPVLFLRSFGDERKSKFYTGSQGLLDFSLEVRLKNHLYKYGPFIAIGSPKEGVPQPGAARAFLADDKWQSSVVTWIRDSQLIVMYAGVTKGVSWELRQILNYNKQINLILIIPEFGAMFKFRRRMLSEQRVRIAAEAFANSPWAPGLKNLTDAHNIRSILFRPDGSLFIIRSKPRNRDSYHLAAMIAHYLLLTPDVKAGEPLEPRRFD